MVAAVDTRVHLSAAPLTRFHKRLFLGGAFGQLTDGYILGTIGIAMSLATVPLNLSAADLGLIGASSLIGILLGSLVFGPLADRIGRQPMFVVTPIVFIIASALQFFVTDALQLILIRLVLGVAIGADYAVALTLVSEWTPKSHRARFMGFMQCLWAAGYAGAYVFGYFLKDSGPNSWRWILLSCLVPAVVTFLFRRNAPESPSWLMSKGEEHKAEAIVEQCLGHRYAVGGPSQSDGQGGILSLFSLRLIQRTIVSATFFTCQVFPYFAISIFVPQIFGSFGIDDPYFYGILFNLFLLCGVSFGTWIVDFVPRRAFLICSFYFCSALLLVLVVVPEPSAWLTICTVSAFSLSISAAAVLCYVYPPELFPAESRASGMGFTVACSRAGAASGTFLLPVLLQSYGIRAALLGCVAALVLGGVITHALAPETGGKELR